MTRPYRPTRQLTRLDPTRELAHLIVDFEDAADFLNEYDTHISRDMALIETDRPLAEGTPIQLRISFPGLLVELSIDGLARTQDSETPGVLLQLRRDPALERIVEQIRKGDRTVVVPVFRVLIVEDNHHVAQLVANGLAASARRELGHIAFHFTTAGDGASALALLQQHQFDVAIVDVYLPVLDGAAFIRQVRTSLGLGQLPIIGLSGGGDAARRSALAAGATLFLDKPVRLRQVVDTMRELLKTAVS